MNLLESAGFSKSNPYYIVPQGRVSGLYVSPKRELLDFTVDHISHERQGPRDAKRGKINELLEYIGSHLEELEEEKEELEEF